MTKTDLTFPTFFVDFAVQFCFRCKFSFHGKRRCQYRIKILCYAQQPMRLLHFVQTTYNVKLLFSCLPKWAKDGLLVILNDFETEKSFFGSSVFLKTYLFKLAVLDSHYSLIGILFFLLFIHLFIHSLFVHYYYFILALLL